MNILHVIVGLEIGGAELMLKRLIDSHQGNPGYCHSVISLTGVGKIGEQLREMGVELRTLGMHSSLDIPRVLWELVRVIRLERPDIVQTWMYHADLLGGLAARLAGNHHVIWGVRTTDITAGGKRTTLLVRKLCAWLSVWLPHTIICAADASRRSHIEVGYDSSRMVSIPNGFETERLVATKVQRVALRTQCKFNDNTIVVGSLGRFHADKDYANFVRAAGFLAHQFYDVRFLLVGRDLDANNAELAMWIAATGYTDRFVLLGERSDAPVCFAAMDIYCLHSRTEGFPNGLGEAMAMGLPCVTADVGDAAFLLSNTGVVVPKNNSKALTEGVNKLLAITAEQRFILGQKSKARIYSEFTMKRCRERFEKVYQHVYLEIKK